MSFIGLSSSTNYSVAALPLYYGLCLFPHAVAVHFASGGSPSRWDNRNPRTPDLKNNLRQRLDAATYAKYERAEAAHYNALESFPLVAAAALAGTVAHLPNEELNTYIAGIGILRAAHLTAYIQTARQQYTLIRSAIWVASLAWSLRILIRAGQALM